MKHNSVPLLTDLTFDGAEDPCYKCEDITRECKYGKCAKREASTEIPSNIPSMCIIDDFGGCDYEYYYHRINYCPYCGEKIEICIAREDDITEYAEELESKYTEYKLIWLDTDSIRQGSFAREAMDRISETRDNLYEILLYDEYLKERKEMESY